MAKASRRRDGRHEVEVTPQRERINIGRSTISAAQARRDLIDALPTVVYQGRPARRQLALDAAPAAAPVRRPAPQKRPEAKTDTKPLRLERESGACKARPSESRGNGGSRPFVPWCSRKG